MSWRVRVLFGLALLCTSVLSGQRVSADIDSAKIRVDINGSMLPGSLDWNGRAVAVGKSQRACGEDKARLVSAVFAFTEKLVKRENEGKKLLPNTAGTSFRDDASQIEFELVAAPHDSYAVTMSFWHARTALPVLLPALYDCLNLSVGSEDQVKQLELLVPGDPVVPEYSPSVGFYRVL